MTLKSFSQWKGMVQMVSSLWWNDDRFYWNI